jgi:hypothetical protein
MSKVQEKDATLLNNLSGTQIADELDSRLRDLEKNIAVAREFIKLADESYSELRHKWNLLHEEVRSKPQTNTTERAVVAEERTEVLLRPKAHSKTKTKEDPTLEEPKSPSSTDFSSKPKTHLKRDKSAKRPKKEPELSSENKASLASEKPFPTYRDPGRRRGKTNGHK